ncbi:TPA: hypothetical protein IAB95_02490 [Candidatus Ventrenecus avicola]|nr:hypothetical protein [Candidatus Ventrenecus avicola]
MGNILVKIKRFLGNKNTVTILCVLGGILVLYIGYNWRVSSATEPVRIPYAKNTLSSRHVITSDDIGYMEVASTVVSKMRNVIRASNLLVGQEVAYGNVIQQNSFFFEGDVEDPSINQGTSALLSNIQDGYTLVYLDVDLHTTYGNAIYPGNYIDLWFEGTDENRRFMYGKFIQSIQVLDVTDRDGNSVFETGSESRTPAQLLFAVPDELKSLLEKAKLVGELVPVPRNKSYSENPGATEVSSSYLENHILAQSVVVPEENTSNNNNNNSNNTTTGTDESTTNTDSTEEE